LRELERHGIATSVGVVSEDDDVQTWMLTESLQDFRHCVTLHSAQRAIQPRVGVDIDDMTVVELILTLQRLAWRVCLFEQTRGAPPPFKLSSMSPRTLWVRAGTSSVERLYLVALAHGKNCRSRACKMFCISNPERITKTFLVAAGSIKG